MTTAQLSAARGYSGDVGENIARLDPDTLSSLDVTTGEHVLLEGSRETIAIAVRAERQDWDEGLVHVNDNIRESAGVGVGEQVEVRPADTAPAERIELAPMPSTPHPPPSPSDFAQRLDGMALTAEDIVSIPQSTAQSVTDPGSDESLYVATDLSPEGPVEVGEETEFVLQEDPVDSHLFSRQEIRYDSIGGLDGAVKRVRELVEFPIQSPQLFRKLDVDPPTGVLLHGPPGTGKTLLARAVANETDASFHVLNGPEFVSQYYGESEEELREVFEEAGEGGPGIVFIDELDAVAPRREDVSGDLERRVVAQLLTILDGADPQDRVVVIGATNAVDEIDPALRRPGRFDREIEIGVPDERDRREVLDIHASGMPFTEDASEDWIANRTHGYVGADLENLVRESAMVALRRVAPNFGAESVSDEVVESLSITRRDVANALSDTDPSAMREMLAEVPDASWDDVGGLEGVQDAVMENIGTPLANPERFSDVGIDPPTGLLLYGPPGTGKTLVARAAAAELDANFVSVRGPELLSKWVGDSEEAIRQLFERARQVAPTIIFFDEFDSLAPARQGGEGTVTVERVVNQLLTELDGLEPLNEVGVIAATNRPDVLDPALLRAGRLDRLVRVDLPDENARSSIMDVHTSGVPLADDVDLSLVAKLTGGYSGSDLSAVVREAAHDLLFEGDESVAMSDLEAALDVISPSVTEEAANQYEQLEAEMKGEQAKAEHPDARLGFR